MGDHFEHGVVGHTGFVGSTLMRARPGARGFNSKTIHQGAGAGFGTLYCAAAPGSMFAANKYPDRDAAAIDGLIASLSKMEAERFVLISTIAVLDRFDGGRTEADAAWQLDTPYGLNRRRLEEACQDRFSNCLVLRLPALFGEGLAKNFIFDLMNPMPTMLNEGAWAKLQAGLSPALIPALERIYAPDPALGMQVIDRDALSALPDRAALEAEADALGVNAVMFHHRDTTYQFYEMARLAEDADRALAAGLDLLHLAPAPLSTAAIHQALTGRAMPETGARLHAEDMRTLHAGLWGLDGPYNRAPEDVLAALSAFFRAGTGA